MVTRTYIERNLKSLKRKYASAKTQAEPLYFSKLAIIELCGWIEVTIDSICEKHARALISNSTFQKQYRIRVESTYGFSQRKHLDPLIRDLIGYQGIQGIEALCDPSILNGLHRNLNELTNMRNKLAHTYIKGFTSTIESPQLMLKRFYIIADGLDHLDEKIKDISNI
ncbi:hypothetical protein [Hirschia litorea]|uniref:RiboL-PSP-HEPN domain-containing protein n=1 Tax=Hirschia litorea TaxID=1199156 RepID=A0ABW2IN33_9PROT